MSTITKQDAALEQPGELLRVRNLHTVFPGNLSVVDSADLTIGYGEAVGIVGESGSGKSMLTRSILGLQSPNATVTAEEITFQGRSIPSMSAVQRRNLLGGEIGVVLQDPFLALNPVVKIGRHFTETLRRHLKLNKAGAKTRAIELIQQVGIPSADKRFDAYPHEMSGGMRQRVCIALGISCGPKLLVADEPTTALDVTTQRQILDLIDDLRRDSNMSMILISHDLGIVANRTDKLIVMYAGQIVESGPTASLLRNPYHRYTAALLEAIPRVDVDRGKRLKTIPGRPPSPAEAATGGCRFAARCEFAQDICRESAPALSAPDADGRQQRCFFPANGATPALVVGASLDGELASLIIEGGV